jgi:hypothetical protein
MDHGLAVSHCTTLHYTTRHSTAVHCTWLCMCELLQSERVRPSSTPVFSSGYDAFNSCVCVCFRTVYFEYGRRTHALNSQKADINKE